MQKERFLDSWEMSNTTPFKSKATKAEPYAHTVHRMTSQIGCGRTMPQMPGHGDDCKCCSSGGSSTAELSSVPYQHAY
eukprot:6079067-Amphidinium_carterae.2